MARRPEYVLVDKERDTYRKKPPTCTEGHFTISKPHSGSSVSLVSPFATYRCNPSIDRVKAVFRE
jgi:hypothetical protein